MINNFTRVKPLLNFPLDHFPKIEGREGDLYNIRAGAARLDGWFLIRCDAGDPYESAFKLIGQSEGEYLLGRILRVNSTVKEDASYFEIFIHGGVRDATSFCGDEKELLNVLSELQIMGPDYIFCPGEVWEATMDAPFDEYLSEFTSDIRFSMCFGMNALTGEIDV